MQARWLPVLLTVLVLLPLGLGATFTVTTDQDWKNGILDRLAVGNGNLELDTPVETLGFETELSLSYWDVWYGDAFVPEAGFTGNDAIAFNGSDPVPGMGNVTQLNYSIPRGFVFDSGSHFSAWARHNATETGAFRVTYRLSGPSGVAEAWVDEGREEVVCATEQAQQVVSTDARAAWYHFNFTLYPADDMVHCRIRDDNDTVIGTANLSTTIDYTRVVLLAVGDAPPWAWFDDVTIPRYEAAGAYHAPSIGNGNIQDWQDVQVDAANITTSTNVSLVFRALDSSGTVVADQGISLAEGVQTYELTVPNSIDANVTINGTTSDPSLTWSIASYTVSSNNTTVSAPSIDRAAAAPTTANPGEVVNFSAELTDDDGDQNTVDLWHRPPDGQWNRINRTTVTPVAADTVVRFRNAFTENTRGTNAFLLNTTDANGLTSETATKTFNITLPDSGSSDSGGSSDGGSEEGDEAGSGGGGGLPGGLGGGGANTTANATNTTADNETDSQEPGTETPPQEPASGPRPESGTNLLPFLLVFVIGLAGLGWYYLRQ